MKHTVRLRGSNQYWASIAGSNDGSGADHVWALHDQAATFATEFDATMVARLATRDGHPCDPELAAGDPHNNS